MQKINQLKITKVQKKHENLLETKFFEQKNFSFLRKVFLLS